MEVVIQLCEDLNIKLENVAYIGDDINDIALLKSVGISATPSSAPEYIKKFAHFVTIKKGGEGCFREFVERVLGVDENLIETL